MALPERDSTTSVALTLAARAKGAPDAPYLLFGDQTLTYGQVDARAAALAASLHELGIARGDRLGLVLPNWPEFAIAAFAAAKLGVVIVPLNPREPAAELQYMLRHSEAAAVVTAEDYRGVDFLEVFEELLTQLPDLRYVVTVGPEDLWYDDRIYQFEDLVSAGIGKAFPRAESGPEEPFGIVYTSGTTGKPKGVVVSSGNLLSAAAGTVGAIELGPGDVVAGVTALFHVFGLGPGLIGTLLGGASLVLQEDFDPLESLDLIERCGVTVHYGVPTVFLTELREVELAPRDLSTLRAGVVAGAPIGDETLRRIRQQLCPGLQVAYSLTETASTVAITRPQDPADKQLFTLGRPIEGTEIRVVDDAGEVLPVESVGELTVRGPGVMLGYYRQPGETRQALGEDGFLRTGDVGMVDEEGYVHVVGRRNDVIIRGGVNVYPREVEDRLQAHPAIEQAVIVGVPDEVLGEAVCACVVAVEGALVTPEEIRSWCRDAMADHKVPDIVRFLGALPATASGKVRRAELARSVIDGSEAEIA
ncbi:MAG TPA: AMP-binding protein [Longimicrobiales bacterium]|nr:AMP-binding protein [Longimicrobiales bacterium]